MISSIHSYGLNTQQEIFTTRHAKRQAADIVDRQKTSQNLISKLDDFIDSEKRSLHFKIDPESADLVIQVFDGAGQLIRQIPNNEVISITHRLGSTRGILFEDKI
jgi:uncharacterized FlaG/YvyC family protein